MTAAMAQRASRRHGVAFRLALPTGGRRTKGLRRKLTPTAVVAIRTWAAREGFGLPRKRQALRLAPRFRVGTGTVLDVLDNESWVDLTYVPGTPDLAWLRTLPSAVIALLVLEQG